MPGTQSLDLAKAYEAVCCRRLDEGLEGVSLGESITSRTLQQNTVEMCASFRNIAIRVHENNYLISIKHETCFNLTGLQPIYHMVDKNNL